MLSYTDLKKGTVFLIERNPYEVLEANFLRMQQRKAVVVVRIRNLATGKIFDRTFQTSDYFEEADIQKRPLVFLYTHRDNFVFSEVGASQQRLTLSKDTVGDTRRWLKPNTEITAVFFGDKLISLALPIKMDLKVTDAPPGIQGDRAQGGTKSVTLETGAVVQAPLFINTGDIIRINTETEEYAERVEKMS